MNPPITDGPASPSAAIPPARGSALFIVWLVVFIDLLGFGIVLPVLPRQAELYLGDLSAEGRGAMIGLLFSIFSLMQFVFSPMWGRISDRIGRKPVLLISLGGSVVFYALYGYSVSLPAEWASLAIGLMLASRVGAGIAGASVGTAAAVIADCTPPERRAKGMALIGIAFGAGFTVGPLIAYFGLALFDEQPWGVGALASGLSFLALLVALAIFRETRDPANKAGKDFFSFRRTAEVLRMPTVGALVLIYFLAICSFAQFEATLALLTGAAFGMSVEDNFLVFATVGAVLMFAGGYYRSLVKKRGEQQMLKIGLVFMILGLSGLAGVAWLARSQLTPLQHPGLAAAAGSWVYSTAEPPPNWLKPVFYLSMSIAVTGFAFLNPSVSSLVSRRSDPARQGEVLGVNQSFASLGRIIGPFLGSVLFQIDSSHTLPYLAAVALLLLVGLLLPRVRAKD
jgi:MFS family permease